MTACRAHTGINDTHNSHAGSCCWFNIKKKESIERCLDLKIGFYNESKNSIILPNGHLYVTIGDSERMPLGLPMHKRLLRRGLFSDCLGQDTIIPPQGPHYFNYPMIDSLLDGKDDNGVLIKIEYVGYPSELKVRSAQISDSKLSDSPSIHHHKDVEIGWQNLNNQLPRIRLTCLPKTA